MTYRISDHSTSDNSLLYRNKDEIDLWKSRDPKNRMIKLLKNHEAFDYEFELELKNNNERIRQEVIDTLKRQLEEKLPGIETLFEDVWAEPP